MGSCESAEEGELVTLTEEEVYVERRSVLSILFQAIKSKWRCLA